MTVGRGIEWPLSWRTVPLWSLFERVKDVGHPEVEMLSIYRDYGVVKKDSRDDNANKTAENREIYQLVDDGWLILNRMKAWQGSVGISSHRGIISGHYICFRPRHNEDSRFLNWMLRSAIYTVEYLRLSRGVRPNQVEIDNTGLRVLPVRLPQMTEQRAIADFLDGETAKIDAIIAKQEELVAALLERRSAIIASAVDVPETGMRLKHVVSSFRQGWSPECENTPADGITEWGVLKTGCVNFGIFRSYENKRLPRDATPRPDLAVTPGEIVISRGSTRELVGSAAVVDSPYPRLMLSDLTYAARVRNDIAEPAYVSLVLGTRKLRRLIEVTAKGASHSMQKLSQSDVLNLPLALPSLDEQHRIIARLSRKIQHLDATIAKTRDLTQFVNEHVELRPGGLTDGRAPREATRNRDLRASRGAWLVVLAD